MSYLEAIALVKDTEHSTRGRVFFTGDISALAKKKGYFQGSQEGAWLYNSSSDGTGARVPDGNLYFDLMRLRETLVANRLLEDGLEPCVTSFYKWPEPVEFRKVDPTAPDVIVNMSFLHENGTLSEKISPSRGALAVNAACFLEKPDGTLIRGCPGAMSYPDSWIKLYGSPKKKYLGVWYSYVDGACTGTSSKHAPAFEVLADMLTLEQGKSCAPPVLYSYNYSCFGLNLALRAHEVQDWIVSSFGATLRSFMDHELFKQAVALREELKAAKLSDDGSNYNGITAALLAEGPVPQQLPRKLVDVMAVYTRTHYKPLVRQLVENVHADTEMNRMFQLL